MDAAIQTADQQLAFITSDEDARRAYEMRFTAMCDETSNKNYFTNKGREEGLAEGHAQGLTEGRTNEKLEIARKMKKSGRPLSEIMEFTGLSAEAVETL